MKKNYFTSIFIFVFGLLFSYHVSAQLQASDDYVDVTNGSATVVVLPDILANDTYNNLPVTMSNVLITQTSSTTENFYISEGSVVFHDGPVPMGTYTLNYMLSLQLPPFTWSNEATIHLSVGCPVIPAPTADVQQPSCASPSLAAVTFTSALPNTVIVYSINGAANQTVVTSAGSTATVPIQVSPNGQNVLVFHSEDNGCFSAFTTIPINPSFGIGFDVLGVYNDFNANGYVDVGDVIDYNFLVTNQGCDDLTNVTVNGNVLTVAGGPLGLLSAGANDNTSFTATYIITQNDVNNGYVTNTAYAMGTYNGVTIANDAIETVQLLISDGIKLVAFRDTNSNGVQDSGEMIFTDYGTFNYQINNDALIHHIYANQPAYYIFESNPANSYDISFTINSEVSDYYTVAPATHNDVTIAPGSGITTYYFAVTTIPYTDTYAMLYYTPPPRPGFTRDVRLYYGNNGNQTMASGTLTFTKNNLETITYISVSGTTLTADGFTYNFTNLLPGEDRLVTVRLQTPAIPTVALGDILSLSTSITMPVGDIRPYNNTNTVTQAVVGSYDPNEKYESHGGKVLFSAFTADDYLTYTITFENTGTANAINVSVSDILDSQLDETTVRMVSASHEYTLDRVANHLTWKFNGIDLPPSAPNTATGPGHGYVTFQVKPKTGFALGDAIPNTADIYFDFNPAIVTNTSTTEFVPNLSTGSFVLDNLKYYPNPVKNTFTVSNASVIDNVVVTSVLGQQILAKSINALKADIDLSSLANGVYFVKVTSQKQSKTIKIIKE